MNYRLPLFTFPVLAIIMLGSGCSTVPTSDSAVTPDQAPAPPNQPMILVEMQSPERGTRSTQKIPLHAAPTLQAAVDQSRVESKYKRFHIAISRFPQHQGGQPQKLISQYDHHAGQIPYEYDYQLQAGDRVVIVEDGTSSVDDIFGSIMAPLRMASGKPPVDKSPF
ncbi:hypothetical protein [Bremerella cremea]|uniref:hypothetical protein n=1 Tax=Bremerella cremea TaxID=1031537 RepID=UPI0031E87C71